MICNRSINIFEWINECVDDCLVAWIIPPPQMSLSWCPEHVNVPLYGKSYFADEITLRILRWGDYPDCPGRPDIITIVLIKGMWRIRVPGSIHDDGRKRLQWCKEGVVSQGMHAVTRGRKRQGNSLPSQSLQKELCLANTMVLTLYDLLPTSDLHNCARINLCHFKPLPL